VERKVAVAVPVEAALAAVSERSPPVSQYAPERPMVTAAAPCAKPKTDAATTQDIRSLFMNFPSFEWLTTLQYTN
jgi:hypothetical protein